MSKTLWGEFDGWTYWHFSREMPPDDLPRFADVIRLWQAKRKGRIVPQWADFDFYDFVGWHGWVNIHEVNYDPFDYRVRLSGTLADELYGQSTHGYGRAEMNEIYAETEKRDEFDEHACRNLLISFVEGPFNAVGMTFRKVEYLELPLSDNGERATHTIEVLQPI